MSKTPEQGERVNDAAAVTGDEPTLGEPDLQQLKEGMADAARDEDGKLQDKENHAEDQVNAVKPDHRESNAGQ